MVRITDQLSSGSGRYSCNRYQISVPGLGNVYLRLLSCVGLDRKESRQAMQITIKSKQMEVSPRVRKHIEQKLQRLSRLVGDEARAGVTVADEKTRSAKDRYAVHLALSNIRYVNSIHATATDINVMTALDVVLDKVTAQLGRQKSRHATA